LGAGVAFAMRPGLIPEIVARMGLTGTGTDGTPCTSDAFCASDYCSLANPHMPDAGSRCCSPGHGVSCLSGASCCGESNYGCHSYADGGPTCCQVNPGGFCEQADDCCLQVGIPPNTERECIPVVGCTWCVTTGLPTSVSYSCCSGNYSGAGICCAAVGEGCRTYPDGGSDACPPLFCGPAGVASIPDGTKCVENSECASGTCFPDAGQVDAGACGGHC
jgi:hypothetical protein